MPGLNWRGRGRGPWRRLILDWRCMKMDFWVRPGMTGACRGQTFARRGQDFGTRRGRRRGLGEAAYIFNPRTPARMRRIQTLRAFRRAALNLT